MTLHHALQSLLSRSAAVILLLWCQGCAPKAPIVSNTMEPWEQEIVQERTAQREQEERRVAARRDRAKRDGLGREEPPDKHNVIVTTLADIVAFPLRGAAWLAHTIL